MLFGERQLIITPDPVTRKFRAVFTKVQMFLEMLPFLHSA